MRLASFFDEGTNRGRSHCYRERQRQRRAFGLFLHTPLRALSFHGAIIKALFLLRSKLSRECFVVTHTTLTHNDTRVSLLLIGVSEKGMCTITVNRSSSPQGQRRWACLLLLLLSTFVSSPVADCGKRSARLTRQHTLITKEEYLFSDHSYWVKKRRSKTINNILWEFSVSHCSSSTRVVSGRKSLTHCSMTIVHPSSTHHCVD